MRNFNQTVLMGKIIIKKSFIVWGILVVVLVLISCEKEEIVGEDLMGTWYMPQPLNHRTARRSVEDVGRHSLSAWNYSQIVTTNSNQEVIDQMKPTVGAISFSGAVNTNLKHMWSWHNQDHSYIDLSNNSWNNFGQEWINPNVLVIVNNDNNNNNEDQIRIYYNNGDAIEINDEIDFTFNGKTLNIPNKTFTIENNQSLAIEGTLSHGTISVPANSPTEIFSQIEGPARDYGTWSIKIEEDGRWVETYTYEDQNNQSNWLNAYVDSTIAEWEVDGDTLFVTYHFDDVWYQGNEFFGAAHGTWYYQIAYIYQKNEDELTLTNEWNVCENEPWCLNGREHQLGIDSGSLEELKYIWKLDFSKTPPAN